MAQVLFPIGRRIDNFAGSAPDAYGFPSEQACFPIAQIDPIRYYVCTYET